MIHIQLSEAHKRCAEITRYKLEISFNKFSCPAPSSSVFCFQVNFMVVLLMLYSS